MSPPGLTPAQTVGPYLAIGLPWGTRGPEAVPSDTAGALRISGVVFDGVGVPVPDALIETWTPEPAAFARCPTDEGGGWFVVVPTPEPRDGQAPHLAVNVFARGLLHRLVTRIYFADEGRRNDADPVLSGVPPSRRATLLAAADVDGVRFDIHLQGPRETVFFDL